MVYLMMKFLPKGCEQTMTKLLKKAFERASELPQVDQNALAKWLLEELDAERKWEAAFAGSEDVLERLADEALKEHKINKRKRNAIAILCSR
jgi:hypothetical protein